MAELLKFASESSRGETENCLQQYSTVGSQTTAILVFKGKPQLVGQDLRHILALHLSGHKYFFFPAIEEACRVGNSRRFAEEGRVLVTELADISFNFGTRSD